MHHARAEHLLATFLLRLLTAASSASLCFAFVTQSTITCGLSEGTLACFVSSASASFTAFPKSSSTFKACLTRLRKSSGSLPSTGSERGEREERSDEG